MYWFRYDYTSRLTSDHTLSCIVSYSGQKYEGKYPMLTVEYIYQNSDPSLREVSVGDSFVWLVEEVPPEGCKALIYEWVVSGKKSHYFDVCYESIPNTVLSPVPERRLYLEKSRHSLTIELQKIEEELEKMKLEEHLIK